MLADTEKVGNTKIEDRTATTTIQIINLSSHRLYKSVTTPVIEKNGQIHYSIAYKSNTDENIPDFQLLDILPYNGDSRGTDYSGTYKLAKLVVTQKDGNGTVISNGNLDIRYTEDEGDNGFGFDEIFEIENGKTLAEISTEEKASISPRTKALEQQLQVKIVI